MGQKIKKLKKIRLHREGTDQLVGGAIALVAIAAILWGAFDTKIPFWIFLVVFGVVYCIVLNFYRCPIRYLNVEDTEKLVVAPADGKIVVIEEVDKAWLPKASEENEHADVMITTPEGVDVLCRQIAGAVARRIVTYAKEGEECYIDEHLGFIKLGSRVDVYLPLGTEVCVKMGQSTTGDQTIIAKLK